jgi:rhomboid family GlyGly-CTERM serine protease
MPDPALELDIARGSLFQRFGIVCAIVLVCAALSLGGDAWLAWGRYDRSAVQQGELWRLLTGHFVHLGWSHTLLNVVALGLLASLLEDVLRPLEWVIAFVVSIAVIDIGLYFFSRSVQWYVGLSGVLHGLATLGALRACQRRMLLGYLLAIGIVAKVAWEQLYGASPFSAAAAGGPVVSDAHLYGAIGGLLGAALLRMFQRTEKPQL